MKWVIASVVSLVVFYVWFIVAIYRALKSMDGDD